MPSVIIMSNEGGVVSCEHQNPHRDKQSNNCCSSKQCRALEKPEDEGHIEHAHLVNRQLQRNNKRKTTRVREHHHEDVKHIFWWNPSESVSLFFTSEAIIRETRKKCFVSPHLCTWVPVIGGLRVTCGWKLKAGTHEHFGHIFLL